MVNQSDGTVSVIGTTSDVVVTTVQASLVKLIADLKREITAAARRLEFEHAAQVRYRITTLRAQQTHKT